MCLITLGAELYFLNVGLLLIEYSMTSESSDKRGQGLVLECVCVVKTAAALSKKKAEVFVVCGRRQHFLRDGSAMP